MPYKIIIVEDSDIVIQKLQKLLEPIAGLELAGQASGGNTAVELIKQHEPDFIILDISLKQGHGIKVLEEIAKLKKAPYVIVLTNLSYRYYRQRCMDLGAMHFFDKTMEFEKVFELLKEKTDERILNDK